MSGFQLVAGQTWTPAPGKRAGRRRIGRLKTDLDGYPAVVYSPVWPNYWGTLPTSVIRESGFRAWIRKMQATCEAAEEPGDAHDWIYLGTPIQRCVRCGVLASKAPTTIEHGYARYAPCPRAEERGS